MEKNFSSYSPYMNYGNNSQFNDDDFGSNYYDPVFNPVMQYEQAYTYYRFLCMQMDYKIKCKEYEKICSQGSNTTANTQSTNSNTQFDNSNTRPR